MSTRKPRLGRPRRYSEYEDILSSNPPKSMEKRPVYTNNIGIFRGKRGDSCFIKISLKHSTGYKGKAYTAGSSLEIPMGKLSSWTWEQLETERDSIQGKADRKEPLEDKKQETFESYAESWLKRAKSRQKSYETSLYNAKNHILPDFGQKFLADITLRDVNNWQAVKLGRLNPSTVKRIKNTLNAILNNAVKEKLLEFNPCKDSDRIRGIKPRLRLWSSQEIKTILKTAEDIDPQFADFILWALNSAMRRSEMLAMTWSSVVSLPNGSYRIFLPTSKSDKPRSIPCNAPMLEILERQKERVGEGEKRIFPISAKRIQRRMDVIREKSKIKDICLHDTRTVNIHYALEAGVDFKTLTGVTGHSDTQMIEKHYSLLMDNRVADAAQKTADYIGRMLR